MTKVTELRVFGRNFRVWFNATDRLWTTQEVDMGGNQIGDARWSPSRDLAVMEVGIMAARPAEVSS